MFSLEGRKRRAAIIHEQSVIVEFEPERAAERAKAIEVVEFVVGSTEDMEPDTSHLQQHLRSALDQPPLALIEITDDPLEQDSRTLAPA